MEEENKKVSEVEAQSGSDDITITDFVGKYE